MSTKKELILIPAKQIFWNPEPGTPLTENSMITISTDASNVTVYYTLDNSVPTTQSTIYKSPYKIPSSYKGRCIFIRARALDKDGNVVAQGTACYEWVHHQVQPDQSNQIQVKEEKNLRPHIVNDLRGLKLNFEQS